MPKHDVEAAHAPLQLSEDDGFTKETSTLTCFVRRATALVCGLVFGSAIFHSGVYQPSVLRAQFRFEDWTMLVVFLSAGAASMLASVFLGRVSPGAREEVARKYRRKKVGVPAVVLGAAMLGAGMSLAGGCPGTMMVQAGVWMPPLWLTVVGGLVGAFSFAMLAERLAAFRAFAIPSEEVAAVDTVLGVDRDVVSVVMAAGMAGVVAALVALEDGIGVHVALWGAAIGALQVPLTLVLYKNTGSSSSFVTIVAWLLMPYKGSETLNKARWGIGNSWQVVYMGGAALAGAVWARVGGDQDDGSDNGGVEGWQAFVGGFFILFGSRMASGCTSGHGIAGTSHLTVASFLAVAGMFAAGAPVAFLLE